MEFWQLLGDLHPKLVQFPLVLLLAGLIFDALGFFSRSERMHFAAKILSAAGTGFLLIAFICGIYAEIWAGRAGIPIDQIEWHELMANIASWGFVILMAWRLFLEPAHRKSLAVYTLIGLGWYSLLVITGYLGGKLVFEYGAAVIGARANNVLSLHDLNVLATRQTDENLRYSEMMHHYAGWMTLALSVSLFVYALFPKRADKLKWVGPALLMIGGIALFFTADLDLYKLTDLRQLRDREVQLHKTLALVLTTVGAIGLWRLKQSAPTSAKLSTPSRVVAIMALIGGGMLFTHVHTVAPYANVAAGVYIAHMVMGLVALGIGLTRLSQDSFPKWRHALAISFAALMCVESVLLITYNEGLPWYIGYGQYNRWGPHQGTVAPYGPIRAELTFDNQSQQMDLYVLDRFANSPIAIDTDSVNVLISRGYSDTAVHLTKDGDGSHFTTTAPFLKDAESFSARAELPVGSTTKMGFFDPWVIPAIHFVPPNEVAKFQCPMHEGIVSTEPGNCPLCGMPMVPILLTPPTTLHDAAYGMDFSTDPGGSLVPPGKPTMLTLTPRHNMDILTDLAIVHEHIMHLIIVSADLHFFDHVHPVLQSNGSLQLPYTFPKTGSYLLYADITPTGQRSQVFRIPVNVGNPGDDLLADDPPLTLSPSLSKPLAQDPSIMAELVFQPRSPSAGIHTDFQFRLTKDGRPINDLQPYLGAMGHCVIISQDTQTYLHCHPEQLFTPTAETRGGPDIPFHTIFPRAGIYKIWGQFKRGDQILIADFVVNIPEPILPPKVINFLLDD